MVEAVRRWDGLVAEVLPKMVEAAAVDEKHSLKVFGNESQCDKYGGCPYLSRCFDPMARFNMAAAKLESSPTQTAVHQEKTMGILDKLVAGGKGPNVLTPSLVAGNGAAPVDRKATLLAELAAIEAKQKAEVEQPVAASPVAPEKKIIIEDHTGDAKALPLVLPPDAPKSDPALASKSDEPAPEPKKRGRKPKAEVVAEAQAHAAMAATQVAVLEAQSEARDEVGHPSADVHLYFVGSPVGVQTKSFLDYVYGLEAAILVAAKFEQLGDIRLLSGNDFGFGRWRGILAQNAKKALPLPGHYIVGTDERALTVAEALAGVLPPGSVVR